MHQTRADNFLIWQILRYSSLAPFFQLHHDQGIADSRSLPGSCLGSASASTMPRRRASPEFSHIRPPPPLVHKQPTELSALWALHKEFRTRIGDTIDTPFLPTVPTPAIQKQKFARQSILHPNAAAAVAAAPRPMP